MYIIMVKNKTKVTITLDKDLVHNIRKSKIKLSTITNNLLRSVFMKEDKLAFQAGDLGSNPGSCT